MREGIRGYLLDADGTLTVADRAVPGAVELVGEMRSAGLPFRVTTNTTRRSRSAISEVFRREGLRIETEEILTPSILARDRILSSGRTRALLLIPAEARTDMSGLELANEEADWVVIGDMGRAMTWDLLNTAFRALLGGATLLALHKNRFWLPGPDGPVLDAGPFVAALEYASGKSAEVIGKPSPAFFELALQSLGLPAESVLVVGDDPEADIAGASAAGCSTALVRTGKGASGAAHGPRPDMVIDSVADLRGSLR